MTLEVAIEHRLGTFSLKASFSAGAGITALFGQSGSGKTTLVNVIAGLVRPDRCRIVVDGETLVDTDRRIFVPKHRRRIGYVFQEGRLFPHLTVRQNLLYGSWFAARREAGGSLESVVDLLDIAPLLERRPGRLSGGEKQRVAIGRALLASPRAILMDEPLASLDDARKQEILPYLERLRDEARVPIVYVSHSVAEVTRLATTLVLLTDGQVAAVGPPAEIMRRLDLSPLTGQPEAGALLDAVVEGHDERAGLTMLRSTAGLLRVPLIEVAAGTRLRVRVRARDVILATKRPEAISALNILEGEVAELANPDSPIADVRLNCNGEALLARLTRHSIEQLGLRPRTKVYAIVKSVAFDRRSVSGPVRHRPDIADGGG